MIYIIDDSELAALLLQFNLKNKLEMEAMIFPSITVAVRNFSTTAPTLIITDQYFSNDENNLSGIELGRLLKSHCIEIPRILVSAEDNKLLEHAAIEAGFDSFLYKLTPHYIEELLDFARTYKTIDPSESIHVKTA